MFCLALNVLLYTFMPYASQELRLMEGESTVMVWTQGQTYCLTD